MNFKDLSRINDFFVCGKANNMKMIPYLSEEI